MSTEDLLYYGLAAAAILGVLGLLFWDLSSEAAARKRLAVAKGEALRRIGSARKMEARARYEAVQSETSPIDERESSDG